MSEPFPGLKTEHSAALEHPFSDLLALDWTPSPEKKGGSGRRAGASSQVGGRGSSTHTPEGRGTAGALISQMSHMRSPNQRGHPQQAAWPLLGEGAPGKMSAYYSSGRLDPLTVPNPASSPAGG